MPQYRKRPEQLLFDHSVKPTWRMRLRKWMPRWPGRRPQPRFRLPHVRFTRRQAQRIAITIIALPLAAGVGGYLWMMRDASAELVPGEILLGRNAPLGGIPLFPEDNPWNTRIDDRPVDPRSGLYITAIGSDTPLHPDFGSNRLRTVLFGIPYVVVDAIDVEGYLPEFTYARESDEALYPIPDDVPIETGGDHHALIIDRTEWRLYELFGMSGSPGQWEAGSGAVFDLGSNVSRRRGWTSADAAGLPILPGLIRADEVYDLGEIKHALRFTLRRTQRAFIYPARHQASRSTDTSLPPMGMRMRLRADVDVSGLPDGARVIAEALKRYGMILADNGGSMFVTGTADRRWKRRDTEALKRLRASDFEVIVPPPPPASDTTAMRELREGKSGFSEQ